MESAPVVPGSPYFIMTYDTAKKLTGITAQTGTLSLEVQEEKWQDVLLSDKLLNHVVPNGTLRGVEREGKISPIRSPGTISRQLISSIIPFSK